MSSIADHAVRPEAVGPAPVAVVVPVSPGAVAAARREAARGRVGALVGAYVSLIKPRIIELLLVTTVPAMLLAHGGMPPWGLMAAVLVGGALAAGAANALNCYLDRDIDQLMRRTSRRPLATHTLSPRAVLIFGLTLAGLSTVIMAVFTNLLATALTVAAIAYYDLVYTWWLKRTTPANTVWGGACGAAPVLIGWAAVTGGLSAPAWALFAIVFFWQPPHFYALAIKFKDDYARAGIPMLPVVASRRRVGTEIVAYSWLTVAASMALWPLGMGPLYGLVALLTGGFLLVEAHRLHVRARRGEPMQPMRLFHGSIMYLTIVFVAVAVDAVF